MRKRPRVPEVLQSVYADRGRTLAGTILYLLPPSIPPANCTCDSRGCLRCVDPADRFRLLLRPEDPLDYRRLLMQTCAAVSDRAPPLDAFYPVKRLEQKYIVRQTVELLSGKPFISFNMICAGYDKRIHSSSIIEDLSCLTWCRLLTRIGDEVMVHLLKYSSIFLVLPCKNYRQVTGCPLHRLILRTKMLKHKVLGKQRSSFIQHPLVTPVNYHNDFGGAQKRRKLLTDGGQSCSSLDIKVYKSSSCEYNTKSRKRIRPFSWQRRRRRQNVNGSLDDNVSEPTIQGHAFLGNSDEAAHFNSFEKVPLCQKWEKILSSCFCCLLLKEAAQQGPVKIQIEKRKMFYNSSFSHSLFPRNHILNRLKPNDKDAVSLLRNIFGLRGRGKARISFSSHNKELSFRSDCITRSLLDILKALIRRVRSCRYLKILNKHCSVSLFGPQFDYCGGDTPKDCKLNPDLPLFRALTLKKRCFGFMTCTSLSMQKIVNFFGSKAQVYPMASQIFDNQVGDLTGAYCKHYQVVSFIWAICRSTIPEDLLGASFNWRYVTKNISKMVKLRRFEKFSLKQCKHRIKTSHIPFLMKFTQTFCCQSSNLNIKDAQIIMKNEFFDRWTMWFYSCYIIPLVTANFYVTESEVGRKDIFYYRKHVWKTITDKAFNDLTRSTYCKLDIPQSTYLLQRRRLGFSKLRFIPKKNGVRPLSNLKSPSSVLFSNKRLYLRRKSLKCNNNRKWNMINFKSVNSLLKPVHAVLRRLKMDRPETLSCSVFDYNDIYEKLYIFIASISDESLTMPQVYIVVCDVWKAFDTVNQDKLLSVMEEILHQREFWLHNFAQVSCRKGSLYVHHYQLSTDLCSRANIIEPVPRMPLHHSVIIDQCKRRMIKKDQILHLLGEHVKRNLVQFGSHLYLQQEGIPQGSVLSSLLCSFYYSHLEKNVILPWLGRAQNIYQKSMKSDYNQNPPFPKFVLLRLIDDFLFISTSKKQALDFSSRLKRGFRGYNCRMNDRKFFMNFDLEELSGRTQEKGVYVGSDGVPFLPWAGLLVNCSTLDIQADYTRYQGLHMNSTLTISNGTKIVCDLRRKLCDYMRPKCHPIFYDSNINSAGTVRLNAYQAFLLCAMKFHCYICSIAIPRSPSTCIVFDIIQHSISYMYKLMMERMCSLKLRSKLDPVLRLEQWEVDWLGLQAYIKILRRKHARHVDLLKMLRARLSRYAKRVMTSELLYAVDDSHSSMFWKIKF